MRLGKPTVPQLLTASLALVVIIVGVTSLVLFQTTQASLLEASRTQRRQRATEAKSKVADFLYTAERALDDVERGLDTGLVPLGDLSRLEEQLFSVVSNQPTLEEATITRAALLGYDESGKARLGAERLRLSVFRQKSGALISKLTRAKDEKFEVLTHEHDSGRFSRDVMTSAGLGSDPTEHPTFWVLARKRNLGRTLWSDLHFSELDDGVTDAPRVVVSVQRARTEKGVGEQPGMVDVIRIGIATQSLDAIAKALNPPDDPHRIAIFATSSAEGQPARLVAKTSSRDEVVEGEIDLFVRAHAPPADLAELLGSPLLSGLNPSSPELEANLDVQGNPHLVTFQPLSIGEGGIAGWFVAVVVPQSHYTKTLAAFGGRLASFFALSLLGLALAAGFVLWALSRGLRQVERTTATMRKFDFSPGSESSRLREVSRILEGLERAKTVARTMGKYLPLPLVQRQFEENEEASLGGKSAELTVLFSDIEGFATLSERLSPGELADYLGRYLETATQAIQETGGTIDKYIGDAIMAFWNAPSEQSNHAFRACEAVLRTREALDRLYRSEAWHPFSPLVTRFGIHTDQVLVGHFGAPSRLSYTAIGDGVTLAARLEPLCKQYGVQILVSESTVRQVGQEFVFRLIDCVTVKGKARAVGVYELLGRRGTTVPDAIRNYERAFDLYRERDFQGALALLGDGMEDGPTRVLEGRCRDYLQQAPPPDWNGVFVATRK